MKNSEKPMMPTGFQQSGTGLTKREYFAAMAMQGLLASCAGEHEYPIADKNELLTELKITI